jgi:hypothetical protein
MRSPFKFLDSFKSEDRNSFFGRDDEIEQLYTMVNQNRLILVYGQSGTGKTSLVQCGLASKFEAVDWYPIFVRKRDDINASLDNALRKALKEDLFDTYPDTIEELYALYVRPIYLLFDQFEELFVLGSKEEQSQFFQTIKEIVDARLPCRIIFIIREEYLAHLYEFEKHIPNLMDRRLRVEKMSYTNVGNVIKKSCEQFNISLKEPEKNVNQIIENLSSESAGIHLPYLQVYLDTLYRDDFKRSYPEPSKVPDAQYPPLEFTTEEIDELGKIKDILNKFMEEQSKVLQNTLKQRYPDFPENGVMQILDVFVSEEGTKRPIPYSYDEELVVLPDKVLKRLPPLETATISKCLKDLERLRLLRFSEDTIEISHDTLATLIDQRRTDEQRQLYEMKRRLENNLKEFQQTKEYLSRKQLNLLELYLEKMELSPEEDAFVKRSYEEVEKNERVEKERQERELKLAQDRLKANKRTIRIGTVLGLIAFIAAIFALILNGRTNRAYNELASNQQQLLAAQVKDWTNNYNLFRVSGDNQNENGEFERAVSSYTTAQSFLVKIDSFLNTEGGQSVHQLKDNPFAEWDENLEQEVIGLIDYNRQMIDSAQIFHRYDSLANLAIAQERLVDAMGYLNRANAIKISLSKNREIQNKISDIKGRLAPLFIQYINEAVTLEKVGSCDQVATRIRSARRIEPYIDIGSVSDNIRNEKRRVEGACGI